MKINNLILLSSLFFLSSCSEKDTRLICDCDYIQDNFEKSQCYSGSYDVDNNSLVFNVSKKKFVFNDFDITLYPDQFITFNEDSISYNFNSGYQLTFKHLNRINLVYMESVQQLDKYIDDIPVWKPAKNTYYQCRVVEGI